MSLQFTLREWISIELWELLDQMYQNMDIVVNY